MGVQRNISTRGTSDGRAHQVETRPRLREGVPAHPEYEQAGLDLRLGDMVSERRRALGLTQTEVAAQAAITQLARPARRHWSGSAVDAVPVVVVQHDVDLAVPVTSYGRTQPSRPSCARDRLPLRRSGRGGHGRSARR